MLGRCAGAVYVHWDRSIGHPARCIGGIELSLGWQLSLPLSLVEGAWLEHLSLEVLLESLIELWCERTWGLLIASLVLKSSEWLPVLSPLENIINEYAAVGAINSALFEFFVVVWDFLHDVFEDAGRQSCHEQLHYFGIAGLVSSTVYEVLELRDVFIYLWHLHFEVFELGSGSGVALGILKLVAEFS